MHVYVYICVCVYDGSPFEVDGHGLEGLGLGTVDASAVAFPHRLERGRGGLALPHTTGRLPKPPGV